MEQSNDPGIGTASRSSDGSDSRSLIDRRKDLIECLNVIKHSNSCPDEFCQDKHCQKMKKVWKHFRNCQGSRRDGARQSRCVICENMIILIKYHARFCRGNCGISYCRRIKEKVEQIQADQHTFLNKLIEFLLANMTNVEKIPNKDLKNFIKK